MANTDSAFGLKPVMYKNGSPWNGQVTWYYVPATDAAPIGKNEPVIASADGADTTGKFRLVTRYAAGNVHLLGSAQAFQTNAPGPDNTSLAASASDTRLEGKPASTACYVAVADDPNIIFVIQEDSDTSTLAAADVGTNCDLITAADYNTTTGLSVAEIDSNTTTSSSAQLRILGLAGTNEDRNNAIGTNAKWLVMINEHDLKLTAGL